MQQISVKATQVAQHTTALWVGGPVILVLTVQLLAAPACAASQIAGKTASTAHDSTGLVIR